MTVGESACSIVVNGVPAGHCVAELNGLLIIEDARAVPSSPVAGFNDCFFRNRDAEVVSAVAVDGVPRPR